MFYFSKNGETIKKYQVNFDKEEIEKIKSKIINNCSRRTHVIRESTLAPNELVNNPLSENISYLEMKNTGRTISYSDTSEDKTLYEYDYILVTYPQLVSLIDRLLNGDETAFYDIMDYKIEYPTNYNELLREEYKDTKKLADISLEEVIKKAENIEGLKEEKELNKNQQSTDAYYNQLLRLIKLDLIDSLSISELEKVESFFNVNLSSEVELENTKGSPFVK